MTSFTWAPRTATKLDAQQVADAVWSRGVTGYTDPTKFGGFVRKLLTVVNFLSFK